MRRTVTVAAVTALLLAMSAGPVHGEPAERTRYETSWINVFWYSRERVDPGTYRRITWYAGAYDSGGENGLWSDLYRSVEECDRRPGRDRCNYLRRLSWYGDTYRGTFTIDGKLTASHLEASYRLFRFTRGEREFIGRFHVATDAIGMGERSHGRNSWSSHTGCTIYTYSGKWTSRQATATGTLALGDSAPVDLGETDSAAIGRSEDVSTDHDC